MTLEEAIKITEHAGDVARARKYRFVIDSNFSFVHWSFQLNPFKRWIIRKFLGWRIEDLTK